MKRSAIKIGEQVVLPFKNEKTTGPAGEIVSFNITLRHRSIQVAESRMTTFLSSAAEALPQSIAGMLSYIESIDPLQAEWFLLQVAEQIAQG